MFKWRQNKFLIFGVTIALLAPERVCELGAQEHKWDRFGSPADNSGTTYPIHQNAIGSDNPGGNYYTVVNDTGVAESSRSTSNMNYYPAPYQDYDVFPSSYRSGTGRRLGKRCTYTGGRIKCSNRRDSGSSYGTGDLGGLSGVDSYAAAAVLGAQPSHFKYEIMPHAKGGNLGGGWGGEMAGGGWGEEEDGGDDGGIEGLKEILPFINLGLLALKGLKGAKAAKGLKGLALAGPLLPILLPILLPLLAPLLLPLAGIALVAALGPLLALALLLFIPIPVVTTGRGIARAGDLLEMSHYNGTSSNVTIQTVWQRMEFMNGVVSEALNSEECVKRMSCEIAKAAETRFHVSEPFLEKLVNRIPTKNSFTKQIKQGIGESLRKKELDPCSKFVCTPVAKLYGDPVK